MHESDAAHQIGARHAEQTRKTARARSRRARHGEHVDVFRHAELLDLARRRTVVVVLEQNFEQAVLESTGAALVGQRRAVLAVVLVQRRVHHVRRATDRRQPRRLLHAADAARGALGLGVHSVKKPTLLALLARVPTLKTACARRRALHRRARVAAAVGRRQRRQHDLVDFCHARQRPVFERLGRRHGVDQRLDLSHTG